MTIPLLTLPQGALRVEHQTIGPTSAYARHPALAHWPSIDSDEARDILRNVLNTEDAAKARLLGSSLHALFLPLGGVDLPEIVREPMR
jgi:plasmid stability protein